MRGYRGRREVFGSADVYLIGLLETCPFEDYKTISEYPELADDHKKIVWRRQGATPETVRLDDIFSIPAPTNRCLGFGRIW